MIASRSARFAGGLPAGAAALLLAACGIAENIGARPNDGAASLEVQLAKAMPQDATEIVPFEPTARMPALTLRSWPFPGGEVVFVGGELAGEAVQAFVVVGPDGTLTPRDFPTELPPGGLDLRGVPVAGGVLVSGCTATGGILVLFDSSGAHLLQGTGDGCPVVGRGSAPDRVVLARTDATGTTASFAEHVVEASGGLVPVGPAIEQPLPAPEYLLLAADADPAGGFAWVASWRRTLFATGRTSDGSSVSVERPGGLSPGTMDGALGDDGAWRLFATGEDARVLLRWVPGTEDITELARLPVLDGFEPWTPTSASSGFAMRAEPNPDQSDFQLPLEYRTHRIEDDAFTIEEVPTTPCVGRSACRQLGESYLLGTAGDGQTPVAFYVFWAWLQDAGAGVVASPLGRAAP